MREPRVSDNPICKITIVECASRGPGNDCSLVSRSQQSLSKLRYGLLRPADSGKKVCRVQQGVDRASARSLRLRNIR